MSVDEEKDDVEEEEEEGAENWMNVRHMWVNR